jgi:hypothetical protein
MMFKGLAFRILIKALCSLHCTLTMAANKSCGIGVLGLAIIAGAAPFSCTDCRPER